MRLIDSLTEDDIRVRLSDSNAVLRAGSGNPALRAALLSSGVDLATAFVLDWIPEQAKNIYTVLDGTRQVLTVQLPKGKSGGPAEISVVPFADFRVLVARRSRLERVQFAVAMGLLREMSGDNASP